MEAGSDRTVRFTFIELFSGIGGFRVGLEAAGGKCVFACEYCKFAQAAYLRQWPDGPRPVGDIRRIAAAQVPPHDVLAAGFPCQSFSNAGRGLGFDDARGQLFFEMVRLARECRPRALLLENVRGLLTRPGMLDEVRCALAEAGYPDLHVRLLDAALVVPQRRRRLFLVGFRDEHARQVYSWPLLPALGRTAEEVLEFALHTPAPSPLDLTLPISKWRRVRDSAYFGKFPHARLLTAGTLAQTLQTSYRSGWLLYSQFVPQVATPLSDLSAASADVLPPRYFSPRECARLMGFPEEFALAEGGGHAYRQLGNSVCPPLVAAIGVAIVHALEVADAVSLEDAFRADMGVAAACGTPSPHGQAEPMPANPSRTSRLTVATAARAAQQEAITLAIKLALAASPSHSRPERCWLPQEAMCCLDSSMITNTDVAPCALTECVAPEEDAMSRVGPFLVADILGAMPFGLRKQVENHDSKPRRYHQLAPVAISRGYPAQTLPAPSHAIKAHIAASCMRRYVFDLHIRACAYDNPP